MVFVSNPPISSFRTKRYAPIAPGPRTSHRTSGGVLTGLFGKKYPKKDAGAAKPTGGGVQHEKKKNIFLWTQTPPGSVIQYDKCETHARTHFQKTSSLAWTKYDFRDSELCGARTARSCFKKNISAATWLILPVVICLSQRLSHACLSISIVQRNCRRLIKTVMVYLMVHCYLDNRSNSRANTCTKGRLTKPCIY